MCQCTLFDVGGVEIHSIECIEYCTKDQSNVEDVEDRSNTPKGCNAMYVEDVEDRSNTPKGCNAMLCMLKMSKMHSIECIEYCTKDQAMSKIDQIHLRAVMLCMSETSKMGKEYTHTFWLITSLILNGFSIRKKFWKAETESFSTIPSNSMYVEACRR